MSYKSNSRLLNRLYLPLTLVIGYLCTTVIIFEFGPIDYYTPSKSIFYSYIFYYMISLSLGYLVAMDFARVRKEDRTGKIVDFKILVLLALLGSLIENMNVARTGSLIPTNIIDFFKSGLNFRAAGEAYYLNNASSENYSTNRILNIASILIAWSRLFLVIYIGYNIHRLSKGRLLIGAIVCAIYPLGAISIGLNKPIMETAFLFLISVLITIKLNRAEMPPKLLKTVRFWGRIGVLFILLAVVAFVNAMESRGVTIFFLEVTSPAGYISVNCSFCAREETGILTGLIWFINYIVQGYHGFSLALEKPFETTFGFGNSAFLLRQFEVFFGVDLNPRTFQEKTDALWGANSHWHSIYTHFANDVGFIGVGFVLFFLGWLFGFTWKLATYQKNVYAILLVPIYAFMFLFFPANNQVLSFVASLSAFIFAHFMMFRTYQKGRNK